MVHSSWLFHALVLLHPHVHHLSVHWRMTPLRPQSVLVLNLQAFARVVATSQIVGGRFIFIFAEAAVLVEIDLVVHSIHLLIKFLLKIFNLWQSFTLILSQPLALSLLAWRNITASDVFAYVGFSDSHGLLGHMLAGISKLHGWGYVTLWLELAIGSSSVLCWSHHLDLVLLLSPLSLSISAAIIQPHLVIWVSVWISTVLLLHLMVSLWVAHVVCKVRGLEVIRLVQVLILRAHLALQLQVLYVVVHRLFINIVFIILQIEVIFIDNLVIVIVLLGWHELLLIIELLKLHVLLLHFKQMLVLFSWFEEGLQQELLLLLQFQLIFCFLLLQ